MVSFGNVAASGGYYIAMAGRKIYAQNTTITGSIGVFGLIFNFKNLAKQQGITTSEVFTHANTKQYSKLTGPSPLFLQTMQKSVEGTYKRFVNIVAKARYKNFEDIDHIAGGRVWSGAKAKEIGLVDEIGDLNKTVQDLKKMLKLTDVGLEYYPLKQSTFERLSSSFSQESISDVLLKQKLGNQYYQLYQLLSTNKQTKGLQMLMPQDYQNL
jgi:protease IV